MFRVTFGGIRLISWFQFYIVDIKCGPGLAFV